MNIESLKRNNILKTNISFGIVFKLVGMFLNFVSIPIVLNYLGEESYGVWITIFSIISWVYIFDVGVGNGLKIRLTEALTKNDISLAKEYICTSYVIIFFITALFFFMGSAGISFFTFTKMLNIEFIGEGYLKSVIFISFVFVLTNFVIGIYKQLFFAIHESALIGLSNVIFQSIIIAFVLGGAHFFESSLIALSIMYGSANLISGLIFTFIFFKRRPDLLFSLKCFKLERVKSVAGIGVEFFIIQICVLIIFTTDNIIITKLLGPEFVTPYSVASQFFQVFLVFWYVISAPLTPLYTDSFIKNDMSWIRCMFVKLNKFFVLIVIFVSTAIYLASPIIEFWLGRSLDFPKYLFLFFGLFVLIRIYGDLYMSFLNAIGKIKLQLWLSIFGAIINIPLSIVFVKEFNMGTSGVIFATCLSLILLSIFMPLEAYYRIKEKEKS